MRPGTFNLRLWFGVASFGLIAAMAGALAWVMSDFLTNHMLHRDAELTSEFLESVVVAERSIDRLFDGREGEPNPSLASLAGHIRGMRDVVRANIYGPDRRIAWSTDAAIIGQRFGPNPELEEAFAGEQVNEIGRIGADAKDEHVALGTGPRRQIGPGSLFIEAYIPLIDGLGQVRGVIELYKVPDALSMVLGEATRVIWMSVLGGGLVLFLALFWIVRHGARIIDRQQADLSLMTAMADVGQLSGAIAHSLRNPMAGIRSTAELLRLDHPDLRPAADEIIGEVDRLDAHVRDLLTYSRSGMQPPQAVDPVEIVADALRRTEPTLRRAGMEYRVEVDPALDGARAWAEPILLAQAANSLLSNAIEAMREGGRIVVRIEPAGPRDIRIAFADSGPGITPEMLARVAEPYATGKPGGLGLGLSLARRIAERVGGRLEVTSPPGGGATVALILARR